MAIKKVGGEIVELTTDQHKAFVVSRQPDLRRGAQRIQPRRAGWSTFDRRLRSLIR